MRWMYNCFFNSKMLMLMVAIGSDYHFEEKKINKPIWVFSWNTQYVHNCIRSISFKNKKKLIIKSRLLSIWSMTMNRFYFWYRYIFWLMITFILIIYQEAQWPHLSNNSIHPNQICFWVFIIPNIWICMDNLSK